MVGGRWVGGRSVGGLVVGYRWSVGWWRTYKSVGGSVVGSWLLVVDGLSVVGGFVIRQQTYIFRLKMSSKL